MYIKITDETHKYFGQYFEVYTDIEMIKQLRVIQDFLNLVYCRIEIDTNHFSVLSFEKKNCEEVISNHEKKRAYWKWKRFKTTYALHKSIEGSDFIIDQWGTPNIKYKDYSFCFFNDSKKWGIFFDGKPFRIWNNNLEVYSHLVDESNFLQWLITF
jgi:hypothetical protein